MAQVVFESVEKQFPGGVQAVNDFTLEVQDKEFLVLVGPSGCGKSTTLRMVAGLEEITKGTIRIGDRVVNDVPPKDRDIAMVFQNYALYPHMTVFNNMAFGLKLRRFKKDEIRRRVEEAADILGIRDLLNRKPKALSGGQRQRVAVGRAIVRKPKVFLFDEPLSNLDAKLRVQMRAEISKLHNRLQATMIYVTHDQLEAMTMGDRIVVMRDGFIQQVDTPVDVYDNPANRFVAGFIGTPPMNFIDGVITRKDGAFFFQEMSTPVEEDALTPVDGQDQPPSEPFEVELPEKMYETLDAYVGKEVVFGIRPEDVRDREHFPEVKGTRAVTARIEVIEPLGSESIWYVATRFSSFLAKVDPHAQAEVNRNKDLVFFVEKAHIFDKEVEQTII